MTAFSAAQSHQAIRARPGATIKRRRTCFTAAGLAGLTGAAVVALASIALAQPAGDLTRREPGGSGSMRARATIPGPDGNVRTKSATANFQYYSVPGTAFQPVDSSTTYAYAGNGCIYQTGGFLNTFRRRSTFPTVRRSSTSACSTTTLRSGT